MRNLSWIARFVGLSLVAWGAGCSGDNVAASGDEQDLGSDALFATTDTLAFKLSAPFAQLIARYHSGKADPPKADAAPDEKQSFSEAGTLSVGGKDLSVRVGIRGNTSPNDCVFPKYKVELTDKSQLTGTVFLGHKKFRVNSHCGNGSPTDHAGQFNRVQNEVSPIREELAYRLLRAADVPTYQTRLAKISYVDSSAANPLAAMERHGLIIEGGDDAAKRFAKKGLIDSTSGIYLNDPSGRPENVGANFTMMKDEDIARVYLAEVLVANFDWQFFSGNPGSFWNIDVFGIPNKATQLPIPQDFDLATCVQALQDPKTEVSSEMSKFRSLFSAKPDVVKSATAAFARHQAAISKELATVEKDGIAAKRIPSTDGKLSTDPGFVDAHQVLDAFFALPELSAPPAGGTDAGKDGP